MKPTSTENGAALPPPKTGRTVLALFGIGTRRCRFAAAFVAVMVGLIGQTATQALAQSRDTVLYLDAPAVSTDRATRAGEIVAAYSDPRSTVSSSALAWLRVAGPRDVETEAPPRDAADAFASVTAPDAEGTPDVTAEAAYDAGETMLAQIEDGAPSEDEGPGDEELAATDAVRPELGYGTQVQDEEPSSGYEAPPAEQPATSDPASSPEPVVPASAPVAEPSGGEGFALEAPASAPAPTELAAASIDDASTAPGISPDTEPDYDATGPISEPAAEPAPTVESSTEPEVQEPASPSGGDEAAVLETPNGPGPGASPAASVEASASPEPAVEPSAMPTAERVEEPEGGSEEFVEADMTPAASPQPTDEAAYNAQAPSPEPADERDYDEPTAAPDTGPTSDRGGDIALAPTSSPPPEDDGGQDDLASASPALEPSGRDDVLENVSEEQTPEVVVQESDVSEGADPAASPPPDFPPSIDETEDEGPEDTGPPLWAPPSEEEAVPYPAPLEGQSTAEGGAGTLASASPAPGEDEQEDRSEAEVSEEQFSEVVVVQEYDTGEGADPTATQPPHFALPGDEVENETRPEPASPAEQPLGAGTEEDVPPSEFPDEHPPDQTDPGSGEIATPFPADDTQGPAPDAPYGAGFNDEGIADGPSDCGVLLHAPEDANCDGVPDSPPSEEAPPDNGGQGTPQNSGTGQAPGGGGTSSPGEPPNEDQQAPPGATEQGPALGGDPGADEPRPETDSPADGGPDQRPDRPREDRKETRPDRGDRRDRGRSGTTSPDERLQRIRVGDGGGEAAQEKARARTGRPSSGDLSFDGEQRPVIELQDGGPSGGDRVPELPASIAPHTPRGDDAATRRESAQDAPQSVVQGPALDLYGASPGHSGVAGRAGKEPTFREQRSRGADAANPEDAEEKAFEGLQAENSPIRTVDPVREGAGKWGDQTDSASVEEPSPATTAPERSPETGFERVPERRTAGVPAQERSGTGPVASQPDVDEASATPQTRPADGKVHAQRTPPIWDRQGVPPSRPQSTEAPDSGRQAAAEQAVKDRRTEARSERLTEQRDAHSRDGADAGVRPVHAPGPPADRATPNPQPSPDFAQSRPAAHDEPEERHAYLSL